MENRSNTSPISNLPVIGSIATMPSRADTFYKMIHGALSQVDKLFVFLDGFDEIPAALKNQPKCHATILPKQGNLHASSRYLAHHLFGSDAVVVVFDDDILYPPDYVSRIRLALAQYGNKAVVGFHGAIFMPPHHSYARNRHNYHFALKLDNDMNVHELGGGTTAFLSSIFRPNPATWRHHHMDDLYLAAEAIKSNLALIALKRETNWLTPLAENQDDSLWRATLEDDRAQSYFMRDILTQYMQSTWNGWWQRP
ncbi:MAG: hypothetical protein ACLQHK_02235 [Gallionellaceae bacterium]